MFRKINICEELFEYIKKCFAEKQPLGQALHRKVMNLFRQYLIIGGMPKVVDTFRKTKYKEYAGTCYVIHPEDFTIKEDIIFLPIYMTLLL